jgi:MFS family permease
VDLLGVRRLPFLARRNYVVELQHLLAWGLFAGLIEGTVSAVVVSKTFGGSALLITVVQATPMVANLVSLLWGALIVGRRKLPVLTALGAASIVSAMSVALAPDTGWGGWIFAAQIALARVFLSGVVTTRASLWKTNYPRSHRGRATAGLQIVRAAMSLPVLLGGGLLFDFEPQAFRWFYPVVAVIGAIGLIIYQRTHVRGEERAMRLRRSRDPAAIAEAGLVPPFEMVALLSPGHLLARLRQVLRDDPRFKRYCVAQMCIGSANLMITPVNTIVLTRVLDLSYTASNSMLDVIPRLVTLAALPLWASLFDRVGVLRFRVLNAFCWCGSVLTCGLGAMFARLDLAGALTIALGVYAVGRMIDGLGQSGGSIAWNIGHLHFAEDDKAELYMGVHVSLTGLRGMVAPFLGVLLYGLIDWMVFLVAFALAALGAVLFARLAREERNAQRDAKR